MTEGIRITELIKSLPAASDFLLTANAAGEPGKVRKTDLESVSIGYNHQTGNNILNMNGVMLFLAVSGDYSKFYFGIYLRNMTENKAQLLEIASSGLEVSAWNQFGTVIVTGAEVIRRYWLRLKFDMTATQSGGVKRCLTIRLKKGDVRHERGEGFDKRLPEVAHDGRGCGQGILRGCRISRFGRGIPYGFSDEEQSFGPIWNACQDECGQGNLLGDGCHSGFDDSRHSALYKTEMAFKLDGLEADSPDLTKAGKGVAA